jgi:hypothetical protein
MSKPIKGNGLTTKSTGKGLNYIRIMGNLKALLDAIKSTEKANTIIQMDVFLPGII